MKVYWHCRDISQFSIFVTRRFSSYTWSWKLIFCVHVGYTRTTCWKSMSFQLQVLVTLEQKNVEILSVDILLSGCPTVTQWKHTCQNDEVFSSSVINTWSWVLIFCQYVVLACPTCTQNTSL